MVPLLCVCDCLCGRALDRVLAFATHGLFNGPCVERIEAVEDLEQVRAVHGAQASRQWHCGHDRQRITDLRSIVAGCFATHAARRYRGFIGCCGVLWWLYMVPSLLPIPAPVAV